ncbi:hypothetical protein Cabys_1211 [Caldithrix abyssi DSM 13497]|uniref:Uncharacterized protein n=1 Tax=Caldithrix abyssi DSM 13497 TaxID=880073 RepID=A0A1J1C7S2_CALAY|nr:hypothetical protein Cabys_1211 [Caldithrix abyssi DSM 13497]
MVGLDKVCASRREKNKHKVRIKIFLIIPILLFTFLGYNR